MSVWGVITRLIIVYTNNGEGIHRVCVMSMLVEGWSSSRLLSSTARASESPSPNHYRGTDSTSRQRYTPVVENTTPFFEVLGVI